MSNQYKQILPKPPQVVPAAESMVARGKSQRYLHPNAPTIYNQPLPLVKDPLSPNEVTLDAAIANVNWQDVDAVREFYKLVEHKFQEMGDWRDALAFDTWRKTANLGPHCKEEWGRLKEMKKSCENFIKRRDTRIKRRGKLITEYHHPGSMTIFNEQCRVEGIPTPRGGYRMLPAWTSDDFYDGMITPYMGDSTALLDLLQKVRKHPKWFQVSPLTILQLASHEMICRLGRIRENRWYHAESSLTPGDIDYVISGKSADGATRLIERTDPRWKEVMDKYGFMERDGLFWIGKMPDNYDNLIATQGSPHITVQPLAVVPPKEKPLLTSGQGTGPPATRSQTGHLPASGKSLVGLAGSTSTKHAPKSSKVGPKKSEEPFVPAPLIHTAPRRGWEIDMPSRTRSFSADRYQAFVQIGSVGDVRPKLGTKEWADQMKDDVKVATRGLKRPATSTPKVDSPTAPFRPTPKKPTTSEVAYSIELGQSRVQHEMRTLSPSGIMPPKGAARKATPDNLGCPVKNPTVVVQFAWDLVRRYVRLADFRMEGALLDDTDIKQYHEFGALKMIDSLNLLASQMGGRYPLAYVYMAERGIGLQLEGLQRIMAMQEEPMIKLANIVTAWEKELGMSYYMTRPGHPDYKNIDISNADIRSAMCTATLSGWVTDRFIDAGIAAFRRDNNVRCIVIEGPVFKSWIWKCRNKNKVVPFKGWGDVTDHSRRLIIFNDDLSGKGNGRHWLLFFIDPTAQYYSIINSEPGRTDTTKEATAKLTAWLHPQILHNTPQERVLTSNFQQDGHSCGIWVIKNALAILNAERFETARIQEALDEVSVENLDRFDIAARIYQMVKFQPIKSFDVHPTTTQNLNKGVEDRMIDNFAKVLKNLGP